MNEGNQERLHAVVEGRVQGVNYRYFVTQQAQILHITGWVRNRWNGAVELVAEGRRPDLDKLVAALRRGPPASYVTDVELEWLAATGEFAGFRVYPTV